MRAFRSDVRQLQRLIDMNQPLTVRERVLESRPDADPRAVTRLLNRLVDRFEDATGPHKWWSLWRGALQAYDPRTRKAASSRRTPYRRAA